MQQQLLRVCVVGSGPAGMYSTKYLLKRFPNARVDVIERFPVPFGLVRFGVAPDHPEVKSCQDDFAEVLGNHRVRFFGNVEVSKNVTLSELKQRYNAVLLAHGPADGDQKIGLVDQQQEEKYVFGAREFVNWYNGFPLSNNSKGVDFAKVLKNTKQVVIVGNGNVALDCARILSEDLDVLRNTDVSSRALWGLENSSVEQVSVVGRRGHPQASYTMKELRELTKLKNCHFAVHKQELDQSNQFDFESSRPIKRMNDLLRKHVDDSNNGKKKRVDLRFFLAPNKVLVDDADKVVGLRFDKTRLDGTGTKVERTGDQVDLPCQLILRSVGYVTHDLTGECSTFNQRHGYGETELEIGVFAVGWCKRGPKGIIGTNVTDAHETVEQIVKRAEENMLLEVSAEGKDLHDLLTERKVRVVDWNSYLKIDAEEHARGAASQPPRPRVKLESITDMLQVAGL